MQYAKRTVVPTEKSVAEIKRTLDRHGASQFAWAEDSQRGLPSVQFAIAGRCGRMVLSAQGRRYRKAVAAICQSAGRPTVGSDRFSARIIAYPPDRR